MTATGRRKLTELGGIGRQMPIVVALYFVGALSISGAPVVQRVHQQVDESSPPPAMRATASLSCS